MKTFMFWFLVLFHSVLVGSAQAEVNYVPALYRVTGVATDDVLNIRQGPSASSPILGTFSYNQTDIEVMAVSENKKWGLVNIEGQSGWTSTRFLTLIAGQPADDLPVGMSCSGTEPFWNLEFDSGNTATGDWSFMGLSDGPTLYGSVWTGSAVNRQPLNFGFDISDPVHTATGVITEGLCSDGMSDRSFGYSIFVILAHPGGRTMMDGCCSLVAPEY